MSFFSYRMVQDAYEKLTDEDGKKPKPGDLIEVKCGVYKHWIVYIGEDNVVHFGGIGSGSGIGIIPTPGMKGTIKKEKLKDVVKDGKWKINNFLDQKYQPRKDDDIVKEACARVGSSLTYDVLGYNCEHFATELRYGKPECRQVKEAKLDFFMILAGVTAVAVGIFLKK
nr:phospholipase A and acyltransferase 4 [Nothobranchius furzeri]